MIEIRLGHEGYPPLLATIDDPPPTLWIEGDPTLLARTAVAIVGSRAATPMGVQMTERLAAGVAARGVVVVSGCARGIDAAAHRAALGVGGATVAVLAGGLDVAVPYGNRSLAARIGREGCLVAEHPRGVPPAKHLFPRRNRIIAGLARVVVVVEASATSGALITARLALEAGREVMAVPSQPLLANAAGVNRLLVDGAHLALSVDDVIHELGELPPVAGVTSDSGALDATTARPLGLRLIGALGQTPEPAETLAARIAAPVPSVLAALVELELVGLVRAHPGQRYGPPPPPPARA
jgi:DNA processing protein